MIRDWLATKCEASRPPVKHLVMLAPANFGSPLAHKGRALIGRVFKGGFKPDEPDKAFQTGTHILKGLELASPYTWRLAERDRFVRGKGLYATGRVLCTVLVGNAGYGGIRAVANEDGGDGTVRVSTANMNCMKVDAIFTEDSKGGTATVRPVRTRSAGRCAFGVMDGHDHGSIVLPGGSATSRADRELLEHILEALEVDDGAFDEWCDRLDTHTDSVMARRERARGTHYDGYQNTVVRVVDQFGQPPEDYLIEVYEQDQDQGWLARTFSESILRTVHCYSDDRSYRSLYVDCTELARRIDKVHETVNISLSATPDLAANRHVGFRTFNDDDIGAIRLSKDATGELFQANRTVLFTVRIHRHQSKEVFRLSRPPGA